MSVATGNKGEKAKKFQSLNINNIYQGSALKPLQKSIPTKHGLQSLGKVPTARRAPANLPSLKAEHSGNDPTINLVPSGQGASGGWSANKEEGTAAPNSEAPNKPINAAGIESTTALTKNLPSSAPATSAVTPATNSIPVTGTFASSLAPKTTWGGGGQPGSTGPFLSQRSPLFGQEFPSLTGNTESPSQPLSTVEDGRNSPPANKGEAKYGPGPSLRPQSFATWSFGGGKQSSNSTNSVDKDDSRGRNMPEHAGSLKFDVGVNSPLLQQGAPFIGRKTSSSSATSSSQRSQLVNKNPSAARPRENLFHGSIIDSEKLKRMDDIDSNDDDWTRTDDTFDYNKKLDSDEEDEFSMERSGQSNWTDQISFSSNNRHSEGRENFAEPKVSHQQRGGRKAHAAPPTAAHEHNHLSFLDEEDHRLSKKNEEVLKNIERARRRRAEEEQKYHRVNDDFSDRRTPNDPRRDSQHRNSPGGLENGLTKSPSSAAAFGKFDVGESEDSDKFESYDMPLSTSAPNRGKLQHSSSTNSVPPRFKRHGVELHSYRRTSPPKERGQQQFSGDAADAGGDMRSSTSRESAENQSQEKDFGALFRPPTNNSGGWGQRRPSCSSDQAEDLSLSSTDHHMSNNGSEDKKTTKETADEEATFARTSGGRHSLKTKGKSEDGRSKKAADVSNKDKFGGKSSSNSKVERNSRGGQRGGQTANSSSKNHEKQRSSDQKMSANHRNRAASQQKKDEDEVASTSSVAGNNDDSAPHAEADGAGWFAPRGQPSRRGRGGISTAGLSRGGRPTADTQVETDDAASGKTRSNRKSHQRDAEWDESSSDKSGGHNDDVKERDGKRRSGDGKSHGGRRDRPKKQPINRNDGANEEEVESNRNRRGGGGGGGNSSSNRSYREDKDGVRRSGNATMTDRERRERENKQSSYERRQNKLPPRLAKQKEQSRFTGQSISTQEAWLDSSKSGQNSQGPPQSGVAWDMVSQQQQQQQQFGTSAGSSGPIVDYEANRALLMQRFRNEESLVTEGSPMRLDSGPGLAVQSMDEAFTAESRENAVHTIIFENTNYKGNRPPLNNQNPAAVSDGEKLMFKMPSDKAAHVMGFGPGAKSEDDLKLDFTFETADVDDKPNNGKTAVNHRPATSVSSVVATSNQPATADDLNLKIASVKKVWETLPSMSPVPGGKPGSEQSSPFAPPSSSDDKGFDTSANRFGEKDSSASMVKVRPQPHSQPPPQNGQQPAPVQPQSQQASHQRPPQVAPPQQGGQTQHNSQSIQMPSGQMHHPTHQGLLQQASLDDRLLGRGNSLAYNQLIGRSNLPNLQSPPSILGQQPSLYQAFQIDPNRAVTNQLYPYPPTGLGGQSLIMPPSSSSGTNSVDIFGSSSSNQFGRQFAGPPPPGSTQPSSAMSSGLNVQSGLMSSGMKASSGIGPIGTKGAFQQGGLGSLPGSGTSPLLIPYDGGFVQNIQRSAAAAVGQTAFYQALAASSQQAAAVATSRQNSYGMNSFPGQQGLVQQQLMRNQVPPQLSNPYMKTDSGKSSGQQLGNLQNRQYAVAPSSTGQQQQQSQSVKATATSFASMSLRNSVLGTVAAASTNGSAPAAVSSSATVPQSTSYSPTPIQRPACSKGKPGLGDDDVDVSSDKKLSEVED